MLDDFVLVIAIIGYYWFLKTKWKEFNNPVPIPNLYNDFHQTAVSVVVSVGLRGPRATPYLLRYGKCYLMEIILIHFNLKVVTELFAVQFWKFAHFCKNFYFPDRFYEHRGGSSEASLDILSAGIKKFLFVSSQKYFMYQSKNWCRKQFKISGHFLFKPRRKHKKSGHFPVYQTFQLKKKQSSNNKRLHFGEDIQRSLLQLQLRATPMSALCVVSDAISCVFIYLGKVRVVVARSARGCGVEGAPRSMSPPFPSLAQVYTLYLHKIFQLALLKILFNVASARKADLLHNPPPPQLMHADYF